MSWITDEILFYIGGLIAIGILLAGILFWRISKAHSVKLRAELEQEYGEKVKK